MSLWILDEQLDRKRVLEPLSKHYSVRRLNELRPGERILDDRVSTILLTLDQPTFITIDQDFWNRQLCHPGYGILYFDILRVVQHRIPNMLQDLLGLELFATRTSRMGKVVRISPRNRL